jgi:hypothetical protein
MAPGGPPNAIKKRRPCEMESLALGRRLVGKEMSGIS